MPFAESMLSTLRSNKAIMRDKSKHFRKSNRGLSDCSPEDFKFPNATKEDLMEIRRRIKKEQKTILIKRIIAFCLLLVAIILFGYLKN